MKNPKAELSMETIIGLVIVAVVLIVIFAFYDVLYNAVKCLPPGCLPE